MSSLEQPRLWRSLAELEGSAEFEEFLGREFPEQAEMLQSPLNRRRFMQLMGASLALSGVGACRWEQDRIVPESRRPQGSLPGVPKKFATAMEHSGVAQVLVATSYDGRPIGVGPNPDHPYGAIGTTAFSQASILGLYDPDRSTALRRAKGPTPTPKDVIELLEEVREKGTSGLHILTEPTSSPTVARLRDAIRQAFPGVRWHEYEPVSRDAERDGTRTAFGAPLRIHIDIKPGTAGQAAVVVAIDCDLIGDHPDALRIARDLTQARAPRDSKLERRMPITRLYAVESAFSMTGALADHRLPVRPSQIPNFVYQLEAMVKVGNPDVAGKDRVGKLVRSVYEDLVAARGRGVVAVGYRQPPEVHAAVARINESLGNNSQNVRYTSAPDADRASHLQAIRAVTEEMRRGTVKTLLILGGNPVYDAPADLDFAAALAKVPQSIHLSSHFDETSAVASIHIPRAHYLETWGDTRTYDGTFTVVQPLIDPLYPEVRSPIDLLKVLAGRGNDDNRSLIAETAAYTGHALDRAIQDGFLPSTAFGPVKPPPPGGAAPASPGLDDRTVDSVAANQLEIVFMPSTSTYDGRFANNAWLQELPDFMTKLVWDNAAVMSFQTATILKVKDHDLVTLTVAGKKVDLPVYILPGVAPATVCVTLGYGRNMAGQIGGYDRAKVASIGKNVYPLRTTQAPYTAKVEVGKTGKRYLLASTQDHWNIDEVGKKATEKRASILVQRTSQENYAKNPNFVTEIAEIEDVKPLVQTKNAKSANKSLWTENSYDGYKWGMAIDLSKCIGCSACVTACQAENNIAVVGKEQVIKNREMHWIRIDRYFVGDVNSPEIAYQPVTCQHCENAPCEQVCPVGATLHSDEGLNDMTYNRCVGTRYCQNNCPYKVRRFNYHYWWKELDDKKNESRKLQFNPDVTVRSRGVMEKCTFCVQRIQNAKISSRNEALTGGRKADSPRLKDGEVKTACQQACPTNAIVFGDLNIDSEVKRAQEVPRSYALLPELNTKPRNAYMARINNPNPNLVATGPETGGGHE